jgi:hypothetical protein
MRQPEAEKIRILSYVSALEYPIALPVIVHLIPETQANKGTSSNVLCTP